MRASSTGFWRRGGAYFLPQHTSGFVRTNGVTMVQISCSHCAPHSKCIIVFVTLRFSVLESISKGALCYGRVLKKWRLSCLGMVFSCEGDKAFSYRFVAGFHVSSAVDMAWNL